MKAPEPEVEYVFRKGEGWVPQLKAKPKGTLSEYVKLKFPEEALTRREMRRPGAFDHEYFGGDRRPRHRAPTRSELDAFSGQVVVTREADDQFRITYRNRHDRNAREYAYRYDPAIMGMYQALRALYDRVQQAEGDEDTCDHCGAHNSLRAHAYYNGVYQCQHCGWNQERRRW